MPKQDSIHKNYKTVTVTLPGPGNKNNITVEMKMVSKTEKYTSSYGPNNHPAWQPSMDLGNASEGKAKQFADTYGDIEY